MLTAAQEPPLLRIHPGQGSVASRLSEVWAYRELFYFFTWRDIQVRYKQTALGVAWAVIQPVLTMAVFSVFLGALARVPSDGVPYPVFVFCGLVPWQLFAYALGASASSLVSNERLVSKVYFPRLILPLSAVLAGLVDFVIALAALLVLMRLYGLWPGWAIVTLPLFTLLAIATAIAVGLGLSALSVRYRDVRHALPFLTQFWLFATPIAYPSSLLPERFRPLYGLNPMAGVVEGFRWALLGQGNPPSALILVSTMRRGSRPGLEPALLRARRAQLRGHHLIWPRCGQSGWPSSTRSTNSRPIARSARASRGPSSARSAPRSPTTRARSFWALDGVSFEIGHGEVVGIIGRNGAGKSTLLKILSRITTPTRGEAELRGRVGALLEVGTGFHPELTGRENVLLSGAILGMKRAEIARKFDAIVAFAGVERFLDTEVKHYSSGMFTRLAFSVAAHLEPEILIVDEVLAVGDASFQRKCLGKMSEIGREGRTVLFVSHNMPAVTRLCPANDPPRRRQDPVRDGPSHEVVGAYLRSDLGTTAAREWPDVLRAG